MRTTIYEDFNHIVKCEGCCKQLKEDDAIQVNADNHYNKCYCQSCFEENDNLIFCDECGEWYDESVYAECPCNEGEE